jgi:hypothetical protein
LPCGWSSSELEWHLMLLHSLGIYKIYKIRRRSYRPRMITSLQFMIPYVVSEWPWLRFIKHRSNTLFRWYLAHGEKCGTRKEKDLLPYSFSQFAASVL